MTRPTSAARTSGAAHPGSAPHPGSAAHPSSAARTGSATPPGRTVRRASASTMSAASAALVLALLAGCGGSPAPTPTSSTSSSASTPPTDGTAPGSTPEPTGGARTSTSDTEPSVAGPALAVHADVTSGAVVLDPELVSAGTGEPATASSVPDADTGTVLTLTVPDPATAVSLDVQDATGGTARSEADRSASVASADGALLLGVAPPKASAPDGSHPRVRWLAADDGAPRLDLDLDDVDPAAFPLTVTSHLGTSVVASTSWGEREGGRSLAVTPTDWGRVSGATGSVFAWGDLLAVDPTAGSPGMEEQLQCHLLGARDKATWNLEPWRPAVSLVEYALARCNPT